MGVISIPCPNSNIRVRWLGLGGKKTRLRVCRNHFSKCDSLKSYMLPLLLYNGPKHPFFLVSLHCVSSWICRLLPFACHIGACWCLPSFHYYFTSFCCCYFPWRCYYCFLSSCCYFPSMHCCYFPSCFML